MLLPHLANMAPQLQLQQQQPPAQWPPQSGQKQTSSPPKDPGLLKKLLVDLMTSLSPYVGDTSFLRKPVPSVIQNFRTILEDSLCQVSTATVSCIFQF